MTYAITLILAANAQTPKTRLVVNRGNPLDQTLLTIMRASRPMLDASLSDGIVFGAISDLFISLFTKTGATFAMMSLHNQLAE